MKAFDLLTSLTATEKRGFEEVLAQRNRASLLNLYKFLKKSPNDKLEKEQLYKASFGEKYNKEKDYLIRNELRLLTNELKRFITERECLNAIDNNPHLENYWYLKALNNRNLLEHYDADYQEMYQAATKEVQLQIKMDMSQEHINRLNKNWARSSDIDPLLMAAENFMHDIRQLAAYKTRVYEQHRAGFDTTKVALGSSSKLDLPPVEMVASIDIGNDAETPLSQYYYHMAMSMVPSENSIAHMQAALQAIEGHKIPGMGINSLKKATYNNLCIMLQEVEQYELAKIYGRKAFELSLEDNIHLGVIFGNYLRILLKTADIVTARSLFEKYKDRFDKLETIPVIMTALIEGEATIGDPDIALGMIQELNTKENLNFIAYKAGLVCVYYRKGEYALAENSLDNLAQYYRDNQQGTTETEKNWWFYTIRQFIKIKRQDVLKPSALKKLKDYYEEIPADALSLYRRAVLVPWFLNEIDSFIQQHQHLLN